MDREQTQSFIKTAEADLERIRGSLLLMAQTGDMSDIAVPQHLIARVKDAALESAQYAIATLAVECGNALEQLTSPTAAYKVLDVVARIEASLLDIPLHSAGFLSDVSDFVDASFDEMLPPTESKDDIFSEFEIDEETFEIFRSEAEDLLGNINRGLRTLALTPADQNALWEVRRSSHTLKGAAGIVGLAEASETAHKMEDLLDKLVELKREAAQPIIRFLETSSKKLRSIVDARQFDDDDLGVQYLAAMDALRAAATSAQPTERSADEPVDGADTARPVHKPIVRVSLERLDELMQISHELMTNRETLAEGFANMLDSDTASKETIAKLESLFETAYRLNGDLNEKLMQIRMVKFSTLETRLSRAVNMTCMDEGKKAVFELANGDTEIDTLIIDSIVEPLLHLLKNAVVHGIETPETRRLIGKNERGTISVNVEAYENEIRIEVGDDGSGVSVQRLKTKAIANRIIDEDRAASMTDREAFELMFDRGLTTAKKIDLNAGRGVGMSIVKESVESRGGRILIDSEPQRGTKFTVFLPVVSAQSKTEPAVFFEDVEEEIPTILVVDDSASIRHQTQKLVEAAGFKCITANNGADALELLLNGDFEPDLILSDVEMPQIDGWELLQYVKTDENLGHIPMVLITSLSADEHRMRAFDLGAADYILKPLTSDALTNITEKLLTAVIA
ncbi:MAG: response regulator [Pyrinomonadaceae bacterium]